MSFRIPGLCSRQAMRNLNKLTLIEFLHWDFSHLVEMTTSAKYLMSTLREPPYDKKNTKNVTLRLSKSDFLL